MESLLQSLIEILLRLLIAAIPVILAITMPVAAEGWVAYRKGDTTARAHRRLTFNPMAHIDPVGTLAVPFICFVFSQISGASLLLFGWAKPLPLSPGRLRRPRIDTRWVAGSRIGTSFAMVLLWAVMLRLMPPGDPRSVAGVLRQMAVFGVQVNAIFTAFEMLPIPPYPGGRILLTLLPYKYASQLEQLTPYATWIILFLLFTGVLGVLITPIVSLAIGLAALLTGF